MRGFHAALNESGVAKLPRVIGAVMEAMHVTLGPGVLLSYNTVISHKACSILQEKYER